METRAITDGTTVVNKSLYRYVFIVFIYLYIFYIFDSFRLALGLVEKL